jgi:hypothetical protein
LKWAQNLRQRFSVEFGCSTRAIRETGQPDLLACRFLFHRFHTLIISNKKAAEVIRCSS